MYTLTLHGSINLTFMSNTQSDIRRVCDGIKELLLEKNAKYGDSALEPVRCMSQASAVEQILVRIDDKLSRISRGVGLVGDDEDVIDDLIGYFVLLKIAFERQNRSTFTDAAEKGFDRILLNEDSFSTAPELPDSVVALWDTLWDDTTGPTI